MLLVALWLHTVAFVIAWGYYGIVGRIVIPSLETSSSQQVGPPLLASIERRALPFVLIGVVVFIVTGSYLLVVDSRYAGLGNFFASQWTVLMLVKHVVIAALVVVAIWYDSIVRHLVGEHNGSTQARGIRKARLAAEAATGLGALVALLTVAAQLST